MLIGTLPLNGRNRCRLTGPKITIPLRPPASCPGAWTGRPARAYPPAAHREETVEDYSCAHAVRSLLRCERCDYSVGTFVRDRRGRLVSGYGVLQDHLEHCRGRAGSTQQDGPQPIPVRRHW